MMRSRFLCISLIIFLFISGYIFIKLDSVKAITDFYVEVNPPIVNTIAEYEFHFKLTKTVQVHDWFHITFPPGTELYPPLPEEGKDRTNRLKQIMESFVVDSTSCAESQGMPFVTFLEDGSMQIRVSSPVEMNPFIEGYQKTVIKIQKNAGIMNPPSPGKVTFSFRTQHEETYNSQPIEILCISKLEVDVTPSVTNTIADYTFRFSLEQSIKVHDTIQLVFPPGTTFTPPLPEEQDARKTRLVQLMNCIQYIPPTENWKDPEPGIALIDYETDGSIILTLFSHFRLNPEQENYRNLVVTISKEAGIVTPSLPGTYRYKIATSAEPTLIESQAVELSDTSFTVQILPPMISSIAEFEFQIPLRKTIKVHDWFCLIFPPGTTLTPPLPDGEKALQYRLKDIVDAFSLFGIAYEASLGMPLITFQNDGSMELKLHSPIALDPAKPEYQTIRIKFSRKAGFTTPSSPGKIHFSFYTMRDPDPIHSEMVELLNLTKFQIEINPPVAGEVAEFSFYYRFEKPLQVHDWIKIKLPPGTTFNPPLPEEEKARKERLKAIIDAITFDNCCCCELQGLPIITNMPDGSMEIKFLSSVEIDPGRQDYTNTLMVIAKEAGIQNPSVPSSVQYYLACKNEPDYAPSQLVRIIDKSTFRATVCPRLTGKVARYKFFIVLEKRDNGWFQIVFPPGTTLNPPLPEEENERKLRLKMIKEAITVENIHCPTCLALPIVTFHEDKSMEIRISSGLSMGPKDSSYQETIIEIAESAGIVNPLSPGSVTFFFTNQQESQLKKSNSVELESQKLHVEISPTSSGSVSRYQFIYIAEKSMAMHQWISFYFPSGTTLNPPIPEDQEGKKKRLKEIGSSIEYTFEEEIHIPVVEMDEDGSLNLRISSTLVFDPMDKDYKETVITITEKAGICLPQTPGKCLYYLALQNEPTKTASQPVEVTQSTTTPAEVILSHPFAGEPTGFDIRFQLGSSGNLKFTEHVLNITFPKSFQCSISASLSGQTEYQFNMISINEIPLLTEPSWAGLTLTLPVLQNFKPFDTVWIHIDQQYGLINPYETGAHSIFISTSTEQEKVQSRSFVIKESEYSARLSISPAKTAKTAWFTLTYYNDKDVISVNDIIAITFPDGFFLPGPICCGEGVTIQGDPSIKLNFDGQTMEIVCPVAIEPKEMVQIKIGPGTAIETPKQPGNYSFKIEHLKSKRLFVSNPVQIEEPKLEIQRVDVSKPNSGEIAEYLFYVAFHPDRIPQVGEEMTIYTNFLENPVLWKVEEKLPEETTIRIKNVKNPPPGEYKVSIEYEIEKSEYSDKIIILPALPSITYQLIGGIYGKNGWFIKPPQMSLESKESNTQIFFGLDIMNINNRYYGKPRILHDGCSVMDIFCYAKSPYGKSPILTVNLKIDTCQPSFYIRLPEKQILTTKQKICRISGNVDGTSIDQINQGKRLYLIDQNLTISGKPISLDLKTGTFVTDWELQEGWNLLLIRLEDEAGNVYQRKYQITLDTTPPEIKLDSPVKDQVWFTKMLKISGYAGYHDPAVQLTINGNKFYPNQIGFFEATLPLDKLGPYPIVIVAVDALDNTAEMKFTVWFGYTIQLKIGNNQATVNDTKQTLIIPPIIQNGRTLVPFRFIGEAIKIDVSYLSDPVSKKVTHVAYSSFDIKIVLAIGNIYATVNGRTVKLDVPPTIIKGSTMIPLRFVAENLGFHLDWKPAEQSIHLQYPGKFADTGQ